MCKEKDAIILAHYYTQGEIQDSRLHWRLSNRLLRKQPKTDAKIIVMCGVHFMAETNKLLSTRQTCIGSDLNAGCSPLPTLCPAEDLKKK